MVFLAMVLYNNISVVGYDVLVTILCNLFFYIFNSYFELKLIEMLVSFSDLFFLALFL
jgi:hypothetical protein